MKKATQYFLLILLIFATLLFSACVDHNEPANETYDYEGDEEMIEHINERLSSITGTCLNKKETINKRGIFEEISNEWSNRKGKDSYKIPQLKLIESYTYDEDDPDTVYTIVLLEKNSHGLYTGIEIIRVDDTSDCDVEEPEDQEQTETTETSVGLPAKEIEGSYTCASVLKVNMKGKDEDEPWTEIYSEEFTFTYNVIAFGDNRIEIDLETVKFGEGPYDPVTGVCEFKTAPEFYEAFTTAKHDDYTHRFTFSRKGDKIQLEGIVVGKDEDSATIGIKD
jgi:hypothetical protein